MIKFIKNLLLNLIRYVVSISRALQNIATHTKLLYINKYQWRNIFDIFLN